MADGDIKKLASHISPDCWSGLRSLFEKLGALHDSPVYEIFTALSKEMDGLE
jgi:hypothetical protein